MSYYKSAPSGRTEAYRFTIISLDDPSLVELRKDIRKINKHITNVKSEFFARNGKELNIPSKRVTIKYRGPREKYSIATKRGDATHYDVYVHDRFRY